MNLFGMEFSNSKATRAILAGLISAISLTNCARKNDRDLRSAAPKPEVKAPSLIADSFVVEKTGQGERKDKVRVGIKTAALDKEFLFQVSLVDLVMVPTWTGMKSRVVAFSKHDGKLYLVEATQGHTVTNELPQKFLLAEYPIIEERDDVTFFDFNAGMSRIFSAGDWYASDFDGTFYMGNTWQSMKTGVSFLDDAGANNANNLVISQFAQLEIPNKSVNMNNTVMLKYYISPYAPSADFVPTKTTNFDHAGFFEVTPQMGINSGDDTVYATKFNANKKIVFAVSANTPAEFKQAVKDGILYWGKTLGANKIEVIDAPVGAVAPDYENNIVQWVTWDAAGFAYADAQMDPRTGEIMHAQVFLTSAFAAYGKSDARAILRKMDSNQRVRRSPINGIKLAGFDPSLRCNMEMDQSFRDSLVSILSQEGTTDEQVLKIAQDYVREVTAHEIGHTLGLRHNFAGTLSSNIPLAAVDSIFKQYVDSGTTPVGVVPSSSVMDYHVMYDSSMIGDMIAKAPRTLSYDHMALQHLYFNAPIDEVNGPLFCTDSHVASYVDCQRFDSGSSHVNYAVWADAQKETGFANFLMEMFIGVKAPPAGVAPIALESIATKPEYIAAYLMRGRQTLIRSLSDDVKVLSVRRKYKMVNELNDAEVKAAEQTYLQKEFENVGGVAAALPKYSEKFALAVNTEFEKIVRSDAYRKGFGANGQAYEFSEEEITRMISIVGTMTNQLTPALVMQELKVLRTAEKLTDGPLADALANHMAARASDIIFRSKGETEVNIDVLKDITNINGERESLTVKLPTYVFSPETRSSASHLLAARGLATDWGTSQQYKMQADFQAHIMATLTRSLDKVTVGLLPRVAARWVSDNLAVQGALTAPALNAK